ncbi:MAG: 3' terminal RNA ribose 2'-O-methyltransferase Hen1 [Nannocystaceae bacterium]
MLLTLTTTRAPASDLGYLLGKNPGRAQSFELSFGRAHVFYPEASEARCTAALLLDVDPVGLVRKSQPGDAFALGEYTNDRPYVASSFLAVAISRVFGAALGGRSRERPALAEAALPLEAKIDVVPARGAERLIRGLWEPLGYTIELERVPLVDDDPRWGESPYYRITLRAERRLCELLRHLTVLIPVLDGDKHYWVGGDEVDKLLDRGEGWLADHPLREVIVHRYLRHQRSLARDALRRLSDDEAPLAEAAAPAQAQGEEVIESKISLDEARRQAVIAALQEAGARSVVDLGCGEGKLLRSLARERAFERILGVDVSLTCLERARDRLRLDEASEKTRARIQLLQGSVVYRDERLHGLDAAVAIEVIEHLDPSRLGAFARALFGLNRPPTVILTTPNREHNVRFEGLRPGAMRHSDHRFEWTREEFQAWARDVAERYGYAVQFSGIGDDDAEVGAPTQMGVFRR